MLEFTQIETGVDETEGLPTIHLGIDARIKSRLKVTLDDGREAGLFLPRGHTVRGGDLLVSDTGEKVVVIAADENVSTVHAHSAHLLARLSYHLGNRHVPLQVGDGWVRYQHDHVLDEMVDLLGGEVIVELAPFEPESGAYGGHSSSHHHSH
ncbi:urease accessory protein UreE [Enterovibrio nigricans]|uniref:Urease accessory protein UreE n=1 Tax=Enterovibrio nigricans DSM 22720 TaxID=1121868 RepID=A0A1T4W0R5_9GAMM|nr:urease accessory protein UreE [Enterovibrio nigricans]PKF49069.1 urease accessory protein UreE [Enterovibrio nigricans]SKA70648.1 urease accessory protein [Enterovibrio nigricans DSM 22720]